MSYSIANEFVKQSLNLTWTLEPPENPIAPPNSQSPDPTPSMKPKALGLGLGHQCSHTSPEGFNVQSPFNTCGKKVPYMQTGFLKIQNSYWKNILKEWTLLISCSVRIYSGVGSRNFSYYWKTIMSSVWSISYITDILPWLPMCFAIEQIKYNFISYH